jgi:membrane protease YdiL (CAAX protease family)
MAKNNTPFNVVIAFLIAFALFGLYWLQRLGLDAGPAYLWLLMIGAIFLVVAVVAKMSGADFWFEVPIDKNNERSVLMFFFGVFCLLFLSFISKITGANIYQPAAMAPLASFGIGFGNQTFAALSAATSPFWIFFIIVISAAVIEELVLGFGFVKMGSLLGSGTRNMLKLDFGNSGGEHSGNSIWDFSFAMIFSMLLFAILHFFNNTYLDPTTGKMVWSLFVWAAGFRLVLNIFIYKFGNFGLSWSIGVHATNNALYLGGATVLAALTTFPGGILIDMFLVLLIFFLILSIKRAAKEGMDVSKDFWTFD